MKYSFRPSLFMTVTMLLVFALCIKLGFWQYDKAQLKQALQTQLDQHQEKASVSLPSEISDAETWRYRRVKFAGTYDLRHQVFLDNQVESTVAGYHVLTPVQVEGSNLHVLVNRGWIPGTPDRRAPAIDTPSGVQQFEGDMIFPPATYFTLEQPAASGSWQPVWQNMDMQRYVDAVPYPIQGYVVRLDPESKAGGFVRNWPRPGDRTSMHLGYAYQWFGFALTLLVIYIVLNIKKVEH